MDKISSWLWSFFEPYYNALIPEHHYIAYLKGIENTVLISIFAIAIGIIIGIVVAVVKVSAANSKMKLLSAICNLYTTVVRGTPLIVQLLIIYNLVFTARNTNAIVVGAVCFGFNSGAYVSEIIRAGIESIDRGQMEAGRSLGLDYVQTMKLIILPQAIKNILPALGNEFIVLIKETSVAGYIAVMDLTQAAQFIGNASFDILPPLIIAAICYLIMTIGLTKLLSYFERRLARGDRH